MKKILALVLALVVAFAFASVAMAEEDDTILLGFASNASDENMNKQADAFCNYAEEWNAAGNTPELKRRLPWLKLLWTSSCPTLTL